MIPVHCTAPLFASLLAIAHPDENLWSQSRNPIYSSVPPWFYHMLERVTCDVLFKYFPRFGPGHNSTPSAQLCMSGIPTKGGTA